MTATAYNKIELYWDAQDPSNEGWAYRATDDHGRETSGAIDGAADDDLDAAIDEACRLLGVEVRADQFARESTEDGGWAEWTA